MSTKTSEASPPSGVRVDTAMVSNRIVGGVQMLRGGRTSPRSETYQAGTPDTPMLRASGTGTSAPAWVKRRSIESAIARDADSACSRASPGKAVWLTPDRTRKLIPASGQ